MRPHLRAIVAADFPQVALVERPEQVTAAEPVLWVNARLVPSRAAGAALARLVDTAAPGMIRWGEVPAAALSGPRPNGPAIAGQPQAEGAAAFRGLALDWPQQQLAALALPVLGEQLPLFDYPHDIVRYHTATIGEHLAERIARGSYREVAEGVFLGAGTSWASTS